MAGKEVDDKELVNKLLAGDRRALKKFYLSYRPRLLAYTSGRVRLREDAEEIVQDAFLGCLDSLPVFSFRSSLWTFLVSIARHEIADYYRRLYAKRAIKYVPFVEQVYSEPMLAADETAELFEKALTRLRPVERKLIVWKYEEELSVKEIAKRLGVGIKAAESKLYRARQSFKEVYVDLEEV